MGDGLRDDWDDVPSNLMSPRQRDLLLRARRYAEERTLPGEDFDSIRKWIVKSFLDGYGSGWDDGREHLEALERR